MDDTYRRHSAMEIYFWKLAPDFYFKPITKTKALAHSNAMNKARVQHNAQVISRIIRFIQRGILAAVKASQSCVEASRKLRADYAPGSRFSQLTTDR